MRKYFLLLLILTPLLVTSQSFDNFRRARNVIVSVGSGSNYYVGELMEENLRLIRLNANVGMEYFFLPRISVRGELNLFRLSARDAFADEADERRTRNLSFFSNNKELNFAATVNLFRLPERFDRRAYVNLYAFAGIGLLVMNPKTEYKGKTYALAPLETEGVKYSRLQTAFPLGFGIRMRFLMVNSLVIEGGYRFLQTDYLDDVSGVTPFGTETTTKGRYPNPAILKSDLSRALSDRRKEFNPNFGNAYNFGVRGNPLTKDAYFLLNVRIEHYLHDSFYLSRRMRELMRYR